MAEAEKKQEEAKDVISKIGQRLATSEICPNKSILVKLLKQAADAFLVLKQSKSLKNSVKPLGDSLIRHGLLDHKDKDIRLLVGICLGEVIRVLAPEPGFSQPDNRDIFRFLLSIFEELDNIASPFFSKRAKLLETIAKLQFYLVILDGGCEDLVLRMFKSFFSVVREKHPQSLISSILSIITRILDEKVEADCDPLGRNTFQPLLDVVLQNIVKGRKDEAPASFLLAVSVLQSCGEKVERFIGQLLRSCIFDRDAVKSVIKESYHEIILEVYQIAPQLSLSVIPHLAHELRTDQVDVRIKVLNLFKKLLPMHAHNFSREYPDVFVECLNRFSDKFAEVRLTALSFAKALYMADPSQTESIESAIKGRLLDQDDKVRMEAVNVVCELAKANLNCISSDLITQAAERLRDKKASVRNRALRKLVELYQRYCTMCAADTELFNEHIEEIPCKVLMLCYEKDCQEFRPQSLELVLEDLLPASLSIEERTRRWIFIFSRFKPPHLKAVKTILSQKRRLRDGLKAYLDLCTREEDNGSGETERKLEALVVKMSSCFPDPAKAKECFRKLEEIEDKGVFSVLQQVLSEGIEVDSDSVKDIYFKETGKQEALALSEFFHILFRKCAFNLFASEHVRYILDFLSSSDAEEKNLKNYQVQLLLTIISAFPSLLRGLEKQFQRLLLEGVIPFNEQLIEMLAREGNHLPIKLSDMYSSLEKVCLEGTRVQSKLAMSAIASLADTQEQFLFSKLCKVLVDSLQHGQNAPTVLQSLGCMAQYSVAAFESQEKVITNYIFDEIFQQNDALASEDLDHFDETSNCCSSCKLKVFGLKALVRSFLPHKHTALNRPISLLLDIIQQILQNRGFCVCSIPCEHDKAFIRLAAAKSVLRLSRKWDLHMSPTMFRLTILTAKDDSPVVRRSFTSKIRKLLNYHAVPSRYACAFTFVALDSLEDLRSDALKYLEEFIRDYGKGVQIHESSTAVERTTNHPVYIVVFLIHVLAHDPNFPAPDCRDEKIYAEFLSPLFVAVQALVNGNPVVTDFELKSFASLYLRNIFSAIKKAEDAVDDQMTPKLHLLAEVGLSILDSLNTKIMSVPHTPALLLLPSSLYRSGSSKMREPSPYPLIGSKGDANFSKKLVSSLKAHVSRIGSTGPTGSKLNQHYSETYLLPSGTRHSKSTSKSGYTDKLLIHRTKEQVVELHTGKTEKFNTSSCDTRGHQILANSPDLGSSVLDNKRSAENKHMTEPLLPCGSMTKPSLPQNEVIVSSREEDTIDESGIIYTPNDVQARDCGHRRNSSANTEAKALDARAHDSKQENKLKRRDRKVPQEAVKKTKRLNDTIGTAESEVIETTSNPTARTRRQKV